MLESDLDGVFRGLGASHLVLDELRLWTVILAESILLAVDLDSLLRRPSAPCRSSELPLRSGAGAFELTGEAARFVLRR